MHRTIKLICSLCLPFILAGCPAAKAKYHTERNEIVQMRVFGRQDIVNELALMMRCGEEEDVCERKNRDRADKLADFMNNHLPLPFRIEAVNSAVPNGGRTASHMPNPVVDVTALAVIEPGRAPLTFTSLSPQGQQALIEYAAKKSKDTKEDASAFQEMMAVIAPPSEDKTFDTSRQVRLLISSSLNGVNPADRLEKVYAFIYVPEGAKIVDTDKLETERPKTDYGKLTTQASLEATLGYSSGVTKEANEKTKESKAAAEIKPSYQRTLEHSLSREFARRNIGINREQDTLFIIQDGLEGVDLSGNVVTTITLDMQSSPAKLSRLKCGPAPKGNAQAAEPACTLKKESDYFQNIGTVKGLVAWAAEVRHVAAGGDTVNEDDDKVEPVVYKGIAPVTLWRNTGQYYFLTVSYREETGGRRTAFLVYEGGNKRPQYIAFRTAGEAEEFRRHVLTEYTKRSKGLRPGEALSLAGVSVGFTLNEKGRIDESKINAEIKLKNAGNKEVNLTNLGIFVTEPDDFPIRKEHVW